MTDPSKERLAAALALAEAVDSYYTKATPESAKAHQDGLAAYRATLPVLRTRAEVDAEIVETVRAWCRKRLPSEPLLSEALWKENCVKLIDLVREPTAEPEP